jgi:hypothetical protein
MRFVEDGLTRSIPRAATDHNAASGHSDTTPKGPGGRCGWSVAAAGDQDGDGLKWGEAWICAHREKDRLGSGMA